MTNSLSVRNHNRVAMLRDNLVDILKEAIEACPMNALYETLKHYEESGARDWIMGKTLNQIGAIVPVASWMQLEQLHHTYSPVLPELDEKIETVIEQLQNLDVHHLVELSHSLGQAEVRFGREETIGALFNTKGFDAELDSVLKNDVVNTILAAMPKKKKKTAVE